MTVEDIIKGWLKEKGYDGLCGDECGCSPDDICDTPGMCQPAWKCPKPYDCGDYGPEEGGHFYCSLAFEGEKCKLQVERMKGVAQ